LLFIAAAHTRAIQHVDVGAHCSVTCDEGFEDKNVSEVKYNIVRLSAVSRGCMASSPAFGGPFQSSGELLIK